MVVEVVEVSGTVVSGSGRGRYFMMQENYSEQMLKKLSFLPYYGTLNIRVLEEDLRKIRMLRKNKGVIIKGFRSSGKTFGNVKAYKAKVNGIKCAVVMPKLSTYTDIIEIASEKKLREVLDLVDGSFVKVKISLG